jgi:hypothetical protein
MLQQAGAESERIRTCTSTQVPHTHGANKYSDITAAARTHFRYITDNVSSGGGQAMRAGVCLGARVAVSAGTISQSNHVTGNDPLLSSLL